MGSATPSPRNLAGVERHAAAAAGEDSVMPAEVADELEVRPETGLVQHAPGIAAYREHPPGLDGVVLVQDEMPFMADDAAVVNHRLAVVLAIRLQALKLNRR